MTTDAEHTQHHDMGAGVGRPAFLIMRAFFAEFWILQVYFKAHDAKANTTSLENLLHWASELTETFVTTTPLPRFMVLPYAYSAPVIELAIGLLVLVGWKTRWVVLGAAAYLVSLDLGLLFQGDHDSVKSNTILLLALLWAAAWERFNVASVDAWLAKKP